MSTEGDQRFFTEIYEQEADPLFRFCLLRVSNRERALEITQETFARLWESISVGKDVQSPRAFIYTVARNLIIDWYRKKKPVSIEALSGDEGKDFDILDEDASSAIEMDALAKQALSLLNKLESQYKEVIYFRYLEGFSPQEISEILGLNANTVSIRITRGMEALRKLMGITKQL